MKTMFFIWLIGNVPVALSMEQELLKSLESLDPETVLEEHHATLKKIQDDAELQTHKAEKKLAEIAPLVIARIFAEKLKRAFTFCVASSAANDCTEVAKVSGDHLELLKKLGVIEAAHAQENARIAALKPSYTPPYPFEPDFAGLRQQAEQARSVEIAAVTREYLKDYVTDSRRSKLPSYDGPLYDWPWPNSQGNTPVY